MVAVKKLLMAEQFLGVVQSYPEASTKWKRNTLTCSFVAKPTALSREYRVRLRYNGRVPDVYLLGADIAGIERPDFPHIYARNKDKGLVKLCLYYLGEWNPSMKISDTIIPWTIEWLLHYEIWLATGKWNGGGRHPKDL